MAMTVANIITEVKNYIDKRERRGNYDSIFGSKIGYPKQQKIEASNHLITFLESSDSSVAFDYQYVPVLKIW